MVLVHGSLFMTARGKCVMGVDVIFFLFLFFSASKISSPTIAGRKRTHDEGTAYGLNVTQP